MTKDHSRQFYQSLLGKLRSYDTVILDVGRVIVHWKTEHQLDYGHRHVDFRQAVNHPIWTDFQCGLITKDLALTLIGAEIGIAYDKLNLLMDRCMQSLEVDSEIVSIMKLLKEENKTLICISNIDKESFHLLLRRYEFWNQFDNIYISSLLGMVKPNRGVFEFVLAHGHIDPNRSVYIDDSEINVQVAAQMGLDTLHFDKTNQYAPRHNESRDQRA